MDGARFDALAKSLAAGVSRRSLLKALAGGVIGGGLDAVGQHEGLAQRCGHPGMACAADADCCGNLTCASGTCRAPGADGGGSGGGGAGGGNRGCPAGLNRCGGACTNLQTDLSNCGACGNVCAVANGTAACLNGACAVAGCNAGYADCNNDPSDGCETALTTTADCGACGHACNLENATSACADGTCSIASCDPGYADCDGNAATGCETAVLGNDVGNCGGCGKVCPTPANATATCAGGACGFACNPGFHECGGACVSNTGAATCGAGCTACPVPTHGSTTCDGTACGFTCDTGYGPLAGACCPTASTCGSACLAAPCDATQCESCDATSGACVVCGGKAGQGCYPGSNAFCCGRPGAPCSSDEECCADYVGACAGGTCQCGGGESFCLDAGGCCAGQCLDCVDNLCQVNCSYPGEICDVHGGCCLPDCTNKCGNQDDGCGYPCVEDYCGEGYICYQQACCRPDCTGKACGASDGRGGTCSGSCSSGQVCYNKSCCTPETCRSGQCGTVSDGCGGTHDCGSCASGKVCYNGSCCAPHCPTECGGTDGCGGSCPTSCPSGQVCFGRYGGYTCCTPNCAGKCYPSSDGCGAYCPDYCPCSSGIFNCSAGGVCTCL